MNIKKIIASTGAAAAMFGFAAVGAFATNYSNGFETNTDGWFDDGVEINQVATGTNSITSADGSYHAEVKGGAFTRWGGYEYVFPTNGFVTQVDIYLDMSENPSIGTDKRFDWSSAISDAVSSHRRDFIFSVGTDPLVAGQFAMSASNNSPGWPSNPGRNPYFVNQSGWYTFRHTFLNNGGVLEVKMDVLDDTGTILHTWTLSNSTDLIGSTVGGNRYGWFVDSDFSFLAIDNSEKYEIVPPTPDQVTGMTILQGGKEIGCGAVVKNRTITVKWDASGDPDFDHYTYQADADKNAPYDFTTNVATNQRTGDIRDLDGTYNYRVNQVNTFDVSGLWSDWCSVTLDRDAPDVEITNPLDGTTVYGTVDIRGTVTDNNPHHYWLVVDDSSNHHEAGPGTVAQTSSFTDMSLYNWDTTLLPDGNYTVKLEARDAAGGTSNSGNKDAGSIDWNVVTVNNTPDNMNQCKNGGWENFTKPSFKNQGDCVSWLQASDNAKGNRKDN